MPASFTAPRYIFSGLVDIAAVLAHEDIDVPEMHLNRDVYVLYTGLTYDISAS
jgi:hypothetical protein